MLELLNSVDTQLFIFFNITLANPIFDVIMPFLTNKYTWVPVWLTAIALLFWKGGKEGKWIVLLLIISVSTADITGNRIKKTIKRIRPCNVVEQVHLTVKKKKSFSMPSNHAANFFAVAMMFSLFFRRYKWWFFAIAAVVAFTRISIGVHYPFDSLVGAMLGSMLSYLYFTLYQKFIRPKINLGFSYSENKSLSSK